MQMDSRSAAGFGFVGFMQVSYDARMRRLAIGLTLTLLLIISIGVGVAVARWPQPHWWP
jgi:hypothetical protein